MENVINKLRIPLDKPLSRTVVSVKRNDSNVRKLCITLTNNGVVYELDNVKMAAVKGIKPDNTVFYNDCIIDDNEIQYTLTSQSVTIEGCVKCEIVLFGDNAEVITSARFDLFVYESVFDDDVLESTNEYNILLTLIAKYEQIYKEIVIYTERAETAVRLAEDAAERAGRFVQELETLKDSDGRYNIDITGTAGCAKTVEHKAAYADAFRCVWFSDMSNDDALCHNPDFQYNPGKGILKVKKVEGTSKNAECDEDGNNIKNTYARKEDVKKTTDKSTNLLCDRLSVTAGDGNNYVTQTYHVMEDYAGNGIKGLKIVNYSGTKKVRIKQIAFQDNAAYPDFVDLASSLSYTLDGDGVTAVYNGEKQVLEVSIPRYEGIIFKSPGGILYNYGVSIEYEGSSPMSVYVFDYLMTDGIGQYAAGQHEVEGIKCQGSGIYGNTLIMRDYGMDTFRSIIYGAGTGTDKIPNRGEFLPYELYFYEQDDNGLIVSGESTDENRVYKAHGIFDARYTFNCGDSLEPNKPVYLKGKISVGRFVISEDMYAQKLPGEDDGYVYIYVGEAADNHCAYLSAYNPIYCFANGCMREYDEDTFIDEDALASKINDVLN